MDMMRHKPNVQWLRRAHAAMTSVDAGIQHQRFDDYTHGDTQKRVPISIFFPHLAFKLCASRGQKQHLTEKTESLKKKRSKLNIHSQKKIFP